MTEKQMSQIVEMRKNNITYAAIAEETGIPIGSIKTFCRREGMTTKKTPTVPTCKYCGAVLRSTPHSRPRLFCSDKCKQTWWNHHRGDRVSSKMLPHTCSTCGNVFMDYAGANRKYCSQACYRDRGQGDGQ